MTIEALHKLFLESSGISTDTRKINKNNLFFALKGENFDGNTYAKKAIESGASYAIIDNPEFNTTGTILVKDVLECLQQLATFHRNHLKTPIIALTGSNGKTTTKELINAVLSQNYKTTATIGNLNNHIGVPLTLLSMTKDTEIGIAEMGANHQKEIAFLCNIAQPDYGYITNFGKAHLEGFGGVKGVIKGKSEMYDYLIAAEKTMFINAHDPIQVEKTKEQKTYSFGSSKTRSNVKVDFIDAQPFVKCIYDANEIESQLIGSYNFNNIAAAITIGAYFKIKPTAIKNAIENYIPKNNRSQILKKGNKDIILDAYNANPTSMQAALINFDKQPGNKIAILGDMFELGEDAAKEHENILKQAISLNLNQVILIGENFFKCKSNSEKVLQFKSFEDFKDSYMITNLDNSTLLIKGSRGMALERVLELL